MIVKCEYCGASIDARLTHCSFCGGVNSHVVRSAETQPTTIAEMQNWYKERHLPPYMVTRFFVGVDYQEPKAFGIYKEGNNCILYKNDEYGNRTIRYSGPDEAYAVNELYQRLTQEIEEQKAKSSQNIDNNMAAVTGIDMPEEYKTQDEKVRSFFKMYGIYIVLSIILEIVIGFVVVFIKLFL